MLCALRRSVTGTVLSPVTTARVTPSASGGAFALMIRLMATSGPRLGSRSKQEYRQKAKAPKLSKLKPRDIRLIMKTLPAPITGRVQHMREAPLEAWVHNLQNERVGMIGLERDVFGAPLRVDIVNEVVRWQLAKRRQGTAKGKNRTEIAGSNRKIRAQKGSGNARQGDGKAPHFVGGGAVFPPQPRSYYYALPKVVRRQGIKIALSSKYAEGNLYVLDTTETASHRTRDIVTNALSKWEVFNQNKKILFLHHDTEMDPNFVLSTRNLPNVSILSVSDMNCFDIVKSDVLIMTQRAIAPVNQKLMRHPSEKDNRTSFVGPPLYLRPQIGVNPIATANRNDFIASLDATDRKSHGNELIKIGENKHIRFVPLTDTERTARMNEMAASPLRRSFRQIVPGPTGGIILKDIPEALPVPVTKPIVVDGAPIRTFNWGVYKRFKEFQQKRLDTRIAEHDHWLDITKQKMLMRVTLQLPTGSVEATAPPPPP